jgi:hypothetical protein
MKMVGFALSCQVGSRFPRYLDPHGEHAGRQLMNISETGGGTRLVVVTSVANSVVQIFGLLLEILLNRESPPVQRFV